MHCFAFDIETVPDVDFGRRHLDLDGLDDDDVATAMQFKKLQASGNDFLPLHQQRIVAISVAFRTGADSFKVWTLGDEDADEAEIIQRFFDGIDRYSPDLVSWNGGGFDLPVLHYRAMHNHVQASRYWENGDGDREFRYNNYLSRYHSRHLDLMDILSSYNARARASLDEMATLLGFPGKLGMSGAHVWDKFRAGEIAAIRDYCETDVVNTFLVYLRFEHMRGNLDDEGLAREYALIRDVLGTAKRPHFDEFLAAWAD